MNMSRRGQGIFRQWALLGGAFVVLHVVVLLIWIAFEDELMQSRGAGFIVLTLVYVAVFALLLVQFFRRITTATAVPPEYREARERGIPTAAKVLQVERTRWRQERRRNIRLQPQPRRYEYIIRVRVTPPDGGPTYEAELADYMDGAHVPKVGDNITVHVHPQQPNVIVFMPPS